MKRMAVDARVCGRNEYWRERQEEEEWEGLIGWMREVDADEEGVEKGGRGRWGFFELSCCFTISGEGSDGEGRVSQGGWIAERPSMWFQHMLSLAVAN